MLVWVNLPQLRGEDVQSADGVHYIQITPAAGTVNTGYPERTLHDHLLDDGFLDFVKERGAGALFYRNAARRGKNSPAEIVAGKLGKWIRSLGVISDEVQPNHGWRHRLKTVGRELRIDAHVLDAIQGHASRTAGDNYGDVTLKAKRDAISNFRATSWSNTEI